MAGKAVVVIARMVAIVLAGAGIGGIASLLEARQLAFVAGVIAIALGGIFIGASNQASWLPMMQRRTSGATDHSEASRGLFGTGYGLAAVVGLLGAGMLLGAAIDDAPVVIAVGIAGLVALALLRSHGTDPQH